MERTCEVCGVSFEKPPSAKGRFCSRTCWGKWKSQHHVGANSSCWRGGPVMRVCETCGATFKADRCEVKKGRGRFCSYACRDHWHSEHLSGINSPSWHGGQVTQTCKECGATFKANRCEVKLGWGRFCSRTCLGKWRSKHLVGEKSPRWLGGLSYEPYGPDFSKELKQAIRDRDGHTCQLCGAPENGKLHSVHHIDYDKKHNEPGNLITLCKHCHSKTNTRRKSWTTMLATVVSAPSTE